MLSASSLFIARLLDFPNIGKFVYKCLDVMPLFYSFVFYFGSAPFGHLWVVLGLLKKHRHRPTSNTEHSDS